MELAKTIRITTEGSLCRTPCWHEISQNYWIFTASDDRPKFDYPNKTFDYISRNSLYIIGEVWFFPINGNRVFARHGNETHSIGAGQNHPLTKIDEAKRWVEAKAKDKQ